jgi:hypothetical protein
MGRGDHVGNAVSDGILGHSEGVFDVLRTVVEAEQDMAVKVNHVF